MRGCFYDQYSVLNYTYNQNGYITHKGDSKTGQYEDYVYDALGRLTQYTVNNSVSYSFEYDGIGNITRNTKVSPYYYSYDASQPNAVSGIEANPAVVSSAQCDVAYGNRNRPTSISQDGWTLQLAYGDGLQRESEVLTHNSTAVCTTNFVSGDCEHEIRPGGSRYLDYIRADGRIVAIHVKNGTTDSIYYVQTDLLGSWERIVDNNRNVVQSSHFDPWGNRMSATDWTAGQDGTSFSFRRGFTGHEHYDRFRIINMNARLYDPVIGRFFSPDPQVQNPFSTQGLNRYTYCGNNPVMYIDPDGEFFIIDSWIIGFIHGFTSTGSDRWRTAWNTANQHAMNDIKIWGGLFTTNSNLNFWGRTWELISRFTWQAPQTFLGWGYAQLCNYHIWGGIDNISYYDGATVITNHKEGSKAVTLGSYINGKRQLAADPGNYLFQHEYGHYLQSQEMGIAYLSRVGIPSILSNHNHNQHPVEIDANRRAFIYFNKYADGFYSSQEDWNRRGDEYWGWNFNLNPLNSNSEFVDYHSINLSFLHAKWYDYLSWAGGLLGVLIDGLCLGIYYNNSY